MRPARRRGRGSVRGTSPSTCSIVVSRLIYRSSFGRGSSRRAMVRILPPPDRGAWRSSSIASRMRWTPIPPGRRCSGRTVRSGSGTSVGSTVGARVLEGDDDAITVELGRHVEPARVAAVAVDDDVGRRLVDGLDEVVHARDRGVGRVRHVTHEGPDLGQPIEIGRDAQVLASSLTGVMPAARSRRGARLMNGRGPCAR